MKNKLRIFFVKVYFGDSSMQLLVFIPSVQNLPQLVDQKYKQRIKFSKIESYQGWTELGFKLKNVNREMSGLFTCKVSTNSEEKIASKRLLVFSKYY